MNFVKLTKAKDAEDFFSFACFILFFKDVTGFLLCLGTIKQGARRIFCTRAVFLSQNSRYITGNHETSSMFHVSYEGFKLFSTFCCSLTHSKLCGLTEGPVDQPTPAGYGMQFMRGCSAQRPSENAIVSAWCFYSSETFFYINMSHKSAIKVS